MKTLGKAIKERIKFRGITQLDLAKSMGISKTAVNDVVMGRRQFSKKHLPLLFKVLDIHEVGLHILRLEEEDTYMPITLIEFYAIKEIAKLIKL